MRGWGLVVALLVGVALVGIVIKELPPAFLLVAAVTGGGYAAYRYRQGKKAELATLRTDALGFDPAAADSLVLLSLPLQLFARGGDSATVHDVMRGTWNGLEVEVFELEYPSEDDVHPTHRWSCAVVELDVECKPVVIEPTTFFTAPGERGSLPSVDLGLEMLDGTVAIRTKHRAYARSLLGQEMQALLLELDGEIAFEVSGRILLAYAPARVNDRLELVQAVAGFARLVPRNPVRRARGRSKPSSRGVVPPPDGAPDSTA